MRAATLNVVCGLVLMLAGSCGSSGAQEDYSGPCWQVCVSVQCGTLGECLCGVCKQGDRCADRHVCVPLMAEEECLKLCEENQWDCGLGYEGCNCGQCAVGFVCNGMGNCFADSGNPCEPQCEGRECGDDSCQGSCGSCADGFACIDAVCKPQGEMTECEIACAAEGRVCGAFGECDCGQCEDGGTCSEVGTCSCHPHCSGKECGNDGCGGSCGTCPGAYLCSDNGLCLSPDACEEPCKGKECGPDGCAGNCGTCIYGSCKNSQCVCTPNCEWKECGPDGCGQLCGKCPEGSMCGWDGACYGFCDPITIIGNDIQKVTKLDIGAGGKTGQALNIDGDTETCSPDGNCTEGLDNQLSALVDDLKEVFDVSVELGEALNNGDIVMLFELVKPDFSGKPFPLAIYFGKPVAPIEQCNYQASYCEYLVEVESFDLTACTPFILFDNAVIEGEILRAGGPKHIMTGEFQVGGVNIPVSLHKLHLTATTAFGADGKLTLKEGVLAGAIPKNMLMDAIDQADEADLPMTKDSIKYMINIAVINDMDTDGDSSPDAASIGVLFDSMAGSIVGMDYE